MCSICCSNGPCDSLCKASEPNSCFAIMAWASSCSSLSIRCLNAEHLAFDCCACQQRLHKAFHHALLMTVLPMCRLQSDIARLLAHQPRYWTIIASQLPLNSLPERAADPCLMTSPCLLVWSTSVVLAKHYIVACTRGTCMLTWQCF